MESSPKDRSPTKRKKKCFNFFVSKNQSYEKDGDGFQTVNGKEINLIEKHEEEV